MSPDCLTCWFLKVRTGIAFGLLAAGAFALLVAFLGQAAAPIVVSVAASFAAGAVLLAPIRHNHTTNAA